MKTPRIVNAVGFIDDDLLAAEETVCKPKSRLWLRWSAVAACAALLVAVAAVAPTAFKNPQTPPVSDVGETDSNVGLQPKPQNDRYKDFTVRSSEGAIVWRWEYRTLTERYTDITVDGVQFNRRGRELPASLVGERLGTYTACGWDYITDEEHRQEFDVYEIDGVSSDLLIAVRMGDGYYVFLCDMLKNDPPETLGTVLKDYGLAANVTLDRLSFSDDDGDYALAADEYVWSVLGECAEAKAAADQKWNPYSSENVGFTVTSEALGVYKHVLYVTEDGYAWTNAYDIGMLYFIGEEAAKSIIDYVKEHAVPTEPEPFKKAVTGKITEITETHLTVDDSILCKDPSDGIAYKVPLDDLRISRYVTCGMLRVGETVQVEYEGDVAENVIGGACAIHEAYVSYDGTVLIPE